MTAQEKMWLSASGLGIASAEDTVKAVLKIATDTGVNGKFHFTHAS
jgi:hypothetical protein